MTVPNRDVDITVAVTVVITHTIIYSSDNSYYYLQFYSLIVMVPFTDKQSYFEQIRKRAST